MAETTEAQAIVVSIGAEGSRSGEYTSYVERGGILYQVTWNDSMEPDSFDLSVWPIPGVLSMKIVDTSPKMAGAWRSSSYVSHGSDACVRRAENNAFPLIKLAHPNLLARDRMRHEFRVLKEISQHRVPIPKFELDPLEDEDGVFGYHLEHLTSAIPLSERKQYYNQVKEMLFVLHREGFAHGAIHPANIMRNGEGELVFINFGFAGRLGNPIPAHIPKNVYGSNFFHFDTDKERLERIFG